MEELILVKNKMVEFLNELNNDKILKLFEKISSGKMLRSKLIFKIAGVNKKSIMLSAIVELIHVASLLHDDVLDDANTRRGVKSINYIYGNKTAIMLGDILYSKGFFELNKLDKNISQSISNAVVLLSIGELEEIELSKKFNSDKNIYFDIIYKKTASLIEASAKSAAILANKDSEAFGEFGKNLGIAFQLVDDILDITSNSKTLGKPAMQDLYEGKVTIAYLFLYDSLDKSQQNRLKSYFRKKLNNDETNWLKENLLKNGSIEKSISLAKEYGSRGIEAIKDKNSSLVEVMENMINRRF